uniref:ATP-dependent zinc metalloprotease YME1L1 n=1 Tax=Cyprinus carpio carpio TaxID=630221 RepID=A0A9J8B341_CYPCA
MFSLPTTFQSQGTVPLTHLINVVQYLKSSANSAVTTSVQSLQTNLSPERDPLLSEPKVNLKDLGLSELRFSHVRDVVERLLPSVDPEEKSISSAALNSTAWRTSHISAPSFFQNKYVWVQNRGFKTMKSKTRHLPSGFEGPVDAENYTPAFMKGLLMKEKRDMGNLEQLLKQNNLPESLQDAFKTGFTEGFMKAQALTQRTQDSVRRTRLIIFVLLLVGLYGVSRSPLFSGKGSFSDTVRFRTTSGLDSAVDPIEMKNVTFEHVKGVEEAKNELQDVVEFLRNPQKFTVLGGKLPKGILLVGPPGTGKTLLARAVAGEADVPFYYASGSEFDEMFVGVGASRIRNLFKEAKASAPCVIFIDELDSVGGKRIESPMHPYSRQTINQLLAEMDGFKPNEGVIVIGATNFAEALDNALVRPGRFDMQVTVPRPDVKGRTEILEWYLKKIKVDSGVDAEIIARGTVGFSGAELENLVNQAALKAAADGKDLVTMKELEFAKDKILMGPERRSVEIDKRNKMITAYHESGHAIVAYYTKDAMPINKATIMPRGPSLGHVSLLPENDRWSETRAQLLAQMDVSMGGRVAEELVFGNDHITTGASSDFDGATKIAQMMVTRFGMSDKLGVMTYSDLTNHSPETQAAVEQEVRALLQNSYERAKKLLKTYSKEHKLLADALLTYETLDAKEIQMILEGKSLDPR